MRAPLTSALQERFRSVTQSYYRGAAAALLVFDISNRSSYNSLSTWLTDARSLAQPSIVIYLVGTKADLEDRREVSFMEASQFALENDLKYLETSAMSGQGIEDVFLQISRSVLAKLEAGLIDITGTEDSPANALTHFFLLCAHPLHAAANAGVIKGNRAFSEPLAAPSARSGRGADEGCGC